MDSKGANFLIQKEDLKLNPDEKKIKTESFTFTMKPDTIKLFNEIQWLKEYAIDFDRSTRDEIIKLALLAYAKEIGFEGLKNKFKNKMPVDISPKVGRKRKQ